MELDADWMQTGCRLQRDGERQPGTGGAQWGLIGWRKAGLVWSGRDTVWALRQYGPALIGGWCRITVVVRCALLLYMVSL